MNPETAVQLWAPLHVACCKFDDDNHAASPARTSPVTGTIQASANTRFVRHTACVRAAGSACATSTAHEAAQQSERRLGLIRNGSTKDARIARGNGKRLATDKIDAQERAAPHGMHEEACLSRNLLGFLSGEGRNRERCPERDSPCAQAPKKTKPSRTRRRDWPRPRHICSGRPFGTLTLDFVPADVTKAFRRNMHYPH